jgi:hypothetical protein
MSFFIKSGSRYNIAESRIVETSLPVATYSAKLDPNSGQHYLEIVEDFEPIKKIYGDLNSRCDKIFRTYFDRNVSTGVLLAGEKGSGKSLLVKQMSILAAKNHGLPTILVSSPLFGENFNKFIQNIEQRCLIIFDEFEKVYSRADFQQQLLTLLDGVFTTTKLFLFTVNDKWALDKNLQNRPGRIFYNFDYSGLDESFIRDYCLDVLIKKDFTDEIVNISDIFDSFNFDMLKALVEETNRFDQRPSVCIEDLNIKPEYSLDCSYEALLFSKSGERMDVRNNIMNLNPMNTDFEFSLNVRQKTSKQSMIAVSDDENDDADLDDCDNCDDLDEYDPYVEFSYKDMNSINRKDKSIVLVNEKGFKAVLKKVKTKGFNWRDAF